MLHQEDSDSSLTTNSSSSSSLEGSGLSAPPSLLSLRIKSFRDVTIEVSPEATVSQCKQIVRNSLGQEAKGRYLRLISQGRLLAPDSAPLKQFSVKNDDVLHAVLAAAGVRGGHQAALARASTPSRRYRGSGVGWDGRIVRPNASHEEDLLSDADDDDEESQSGDEEAPSQERLGFDRLRTSGMSRHEISAVRSYFSRHVDRFIQEHGNLIQEEDPTRRRYLYEDAWMQQQGPASEFRLNLNGNNPLLRLSTTPTALFPTRMGNDRDFLWGFLLGFFVGFLMLVWVWMPTVPHKQKLGILTGISLQLALTLLRQADDDGGEATLED